MNIEIDFQELFWRPILYSYRAMLVSRFDIVVMIFVPLGVALEVVVPLLECEKNIVFLH